MRKLKWNRHNVTTERHNWRIVIARFDVSDYWFGYYAVSWTGSQIAVFRKVARLFEASSVEVKYGYDDDDRLTEPEERIITVVDYTKEDGTEVLEFRRELEVPEGARRRFRRYTVDELLNTNGRTGKETGKCR